MPAAGRCIINGTKRGGIPRCIGGRVMKNFNTNTCSFLARALFFGLLLSVSWASFGQDARSGITTEAAAVDVEQVNINHADAETIARILNGIGMSRAEAIVSYRETYGDFTSLEDLMLVKGVGEVTVRNNEARIRFD